MSKNLNPEKALIFRIVHRDNVPWILDHGFHCGSSATSNPGYITIGNTDLIAKRASRAVPAVPHGTLEDYVPFYFTPYSPMLYNIKTGYGGVTRRSNDEIVIFVSSLHRLQRMELPFVFSDRHAFLRTARFSADIADLNRIDWKILQERDFKRDINDLQKVDRYQAEALVWGHVPVEALLGVGCDTEAVGTWLEAEIGKRDLKLPVYVKPTWYF